MARRRVPYPAGEPSAAGSKGVTSIPFGIVRTGPFVRPVVEIASATSWLTQIRIAPLGEVTIELRALVGVPNVLDEVDSGIGQSVQAVPDQVAPVHPGKEEHVAARRLPALGRDPVSGGPELPAFASLRLVRGLAAERDPRCKARHPHNVLEVIGMLEMPAVQTHVIPVEPDRSCLLSIRESGHPAVAQPLYSESREQPSDDLAEGTVTSPHRAATICAPVDLRIASGLHPALHRPRRILSATCPQSAGL